MVDLNQSRPDAVHPRRHANVVFDEVKKAWPDLHPVLDLRYGVADALRARGYRRVAPVPTNVNADGEGD